MTRRVWRGNDLSWQSLESRPVELRKDWATRAFGGWTGGDWADPGTEPILVPVEPDPDWSDAT